MSKFFGSLFKWVIILLVWGSLILGLIGLYYYYDLPSLEEMESQNSEQIIEVGYSNGRKITTLGDLYSNQITYNQIPDHLIDAVIATEDRRFFTHSGIDIFGIMRASWVNYRADRIVQGGSTITQQLAKLIFLTPEKTFKRKIQEAILAWQLERTFSKEQILTLYLNRAYFGAGNYGIASASRYYFGKSVSKLNLSQSAMLAGLLKAPSILSPDVSKKLARKRTNQVLANMIDAGYLGEENFNELDKPINYKTDRLGRFYFSDYVASQFTDYLSRGDIINNNRFKIKTTLNEDFQKVVEQALDKFIKNNQKKIGSSQIAIILMKNNGAILSMVGGKSYQKSQFNRAVYSKRQPGSAFKTFIYLTALQNGLTPDSLITDKKVSLGKWSPENYQKKYYGKVSLKTAFSKSLNSVAVQLVAKLDKSQIIKNALKMGIISEINNNDATIALGTGQVSLLEIVNSYATIANDGYAVLPYIIEDIKGNKKGVLYKKETSGNYKVIEDKELVMIKEMLRDVVRNGTGKSANIARDIYGKTGTSQNYRDAWFIGFNDNYILGIWMGNDNNSATNKITGGSLPAELFAQIMKQLY
jgi:penicillin-binding protein 1A